MLDNNFGKCEPIFIILSPADSWDILFVHTYTQTSTSPAMCCYTTLWTSKIQNVTDFDSILNKLLTCSRGRFEHLI